MILPPIQSSAKISSPGLYKLWPSPFPQRKRNHRQAQRLAAIVDTQTTGKKAIPKSIVQQHSRSHACRDKRACLYFRKKRNIFGCVTDNGGFASGAAQSIQADTIISLAI